MPAIRHDAMLLRMIKDLNDIRSVLRRVVANIPLFDIANENTPAQITANQDNYVIGNYDVLRLSSDRVVFISGLRGGVKGRSLRLFNVGNYLIVLKDQSLDSDTENRFSFQRGYNPVSLLNISPLSSVLLYYDSTLQKWLSLQETNFDFYDDWDIQTPATADNYIGIYFSESQDLFVAVGNTGVAGVIQTSPDGIVWTSRANPIVGGSSFNDVIWCEDLGIWVIAGATAQKFLTSPDGIVWTATPFLPSANAWSGITYSPSLGLFAAVSSNPVVDTCIITSPDGINWTEQTLPDTATSSQITWSPGLGLFLFVDGTDTFRSSDGINWTQGVCPVSVDWIAWSPKFSRFCAIGNSDYAYSPDGINWSSGSLPESNIWRRLRWSESFEYFISQSTDGTNRVLYSSDGANWYVAAAAEVKSYYDNASSQNLVVIVGVNAIMTAPS